MSDTIKINAEVDLDAIKEAIEKSGDLNDNEAVFSALSQVARVKADVGVILDQIASIEAEAKAAIKAKATALYGADWTAIKGTGYKINKSPTGAVYTISGKPNKKFIKVTESLDTKLVEAFVMTNNKLPAGVDYNPSRGETIKLTVQTDE